MNDKIFISWENIHNIIDDFVEKYKHIHIDEIIRNTEIIAIARGGLIPAQLIAYKLGIQKIRTVGMKVFNADEVEERYEVPIFYQDITSNLNSNILIIDDICDTGTTLIHISNRLKELGFINEAENHIECFTLFAKYYSKYGVSYYGTMVPDSSWVVFPWDIYKGDSGHVYGI